MNQHKLEYLTATTIILTVLGPPTALLKILLTVIALDYFTGVLKAGYERRLNSNIGAKGIIKKIGYMAGVALAHQIDAWVGSGDAFRLLSMSLFIANEAWSNAENLAAVGVALPKPVVDKIKEFMDPNKER